MCPGLSNAVSIIIFRCLVMKIQPDEVTTFSVIFDAFLVVQNPFKNVCKVNSKENVVKKNFENFFSRFWIFMSFGQKISCSI